MYTQVLIGWKSCFSNFILKYGKCSSGHSPKGKKHFFRVPKCGKTRNNTLVCDNFCESWKHLKIARKYCLKWFVSFHYSIGCPRVYVNFYFALIYNAIETKYLYFSMSLLKTHHYLLKILAEISLTLLILVRTFVHQEILVKK